MHCTQVRMYTTAMTSQHTDGVGLCATDLILWEVRVHLVTVEVGVVGLAVGVM